MENVEEKPKRTRKKKAVEPETVEQEPATVQDAEASLQEMPAEASVTVSKAKEKPKANAYTVKVKASLLNLRERPEANARIIGVAKHNDRLTVIDDLDEGWGKLESGYVLLKFTERVDG